ncbi:MAG: hypothetical protein ACI4UG_04085, partial [Candidatus Onthovivens sp.]
LDQSSINQGVGAARFAISNPNDGSSSSVNLRLEQIEGANDTSDFGINFHYVDSSLGNLNAYTYKEKSVMESIKILQEFGDDTANENNILYSYVTSIETILKLLTGTSSLSSSTKEAKEEVSFNINKLSGIVSLPDDYDIAGDNFTNDSTNYYPIDNTIRLKVDLSSISDSFSSPFTIVVDFSDDNISNNALFSLRVENLKIGDNFGTFKLYVKNPGDNLSNLKIGNLDINEKGSATPFVDLTDLPILVKMAIKTCDTRKYYISGTFNLKVSRLAGTFTGLEGRNLDIHIYLRVSDIKNENNVNLVDALLYFVGNEGEEITVDEVDKTRYKETTKKFETFIYIKGTDVYIKQIRNLSVQKQKKGLFGIWSKDGSAYNAVDLDYFKSTSDDFVKNIFYYLFVLIFNSHKDYDKVLEYSAQFGDMSVEPLNMLKTMTHSGNSWVIGAAYKAFVDVFSATITLNHDENYKLTSISLAAKVILNLFELELNATNNEFTVSNQLNYDNAMNNFGTFIDAFNSDPNTANLEYRTGEEETATNIFKVNRGSEGMTGALNYNGKIF